MEDLKKYTPIELNKMINDVKEKHDTLKQEVIAHTIEIDSLEKVINEKIMVISQLEKNYIELIEEITSR
jgi:hypothetical protein